MVRKTLEERSRPTKPLPARSRRALNPSVGTRKSVRFDVPPTPPKVDDRPATKAQSFSAPLTLRVPPLSRASSSSRTTVSRASSSRSTATLFAEEEVEKASSATTKTKAKGKGKGKARQEEAAKDADHDGKALNAKAEPEEPVSTGPATGSATPAVGLLTRRRALKEGIVVMPIFEAQLQVFGVSTSGNKSG